MINIQKIKTTNAVRAALSIGLTLLVTSSLFGQSTDQSKQAGASAQPGGGTQTVNAQQSGSWTVGLDPARNTVRLANSEADPLPVKVISNGGGRKAYQKRVTFDVGVGNNQGGLSFSIPAGKRFVIESMSAAVRVPQGIQPYLHMFTYMDDGDGVFNPAADSGNQRFVLVEQMNSAGLTTWTANQKVVVYLDENIGGTQINHTVALEVSGNVSLLSKGDVTFTGYLEDLPAPQN